MANHADSTLRERVGAILAALEKGYPDAVCSLTYKTPLQLLIATILSAQCTDTLVNKVTPALFEKYNTAADFAKASLPELQQAVNRVNFFRNKAKYIQKTCRILVERFNGEVPSSMDELLKLPGVARKTANVVMGNAFGIASGIVVDTHVIRLAKRMGFFESSNRDAMEQALMRIVPRERWTRFSHQMILHGRRVCKARVALCGECMIGKALCPVYSEPTERA